ncbi:mucin-2-like [Macrobrachium rosenbergii]|uniref:mucin-2-like n=1 Tax=Macrobrachium rosenbergii TaxID=79674 RepID=UPI0034D6775C
MFKKNLKWASESDLLIFRQPKGLLSTNFLSSTLPLQQPRSLPPLPVSSASFATQTSKESPIVIRHIHEFKLSPSPTNEDSGCCRTSPSSCEGCDDNGCVEDHSPDYVGTLDSGVSGVFSNTLESGLSGVYRCLSPVIPSIVEECTTHHMSDIIPALGGQRSNSPPVMHHSHPAHTSCLHCCFQNSSQDMNKEMGSCGGPNVRVSSPCPPRPHTVCSYSPPYKYNHTTSLSTTPIPSIHVSPSLSPLPNSPNVSLAFCLPSTVVEVSTIQASPGVLSCNKTSENLMTMCSLPPASATSLTSLTYVTSPTSASLSQARKTCPAYSRPLIPPDSPTPHNSPRLPNSINATRSRATKSPPFPNALVTETVPDSVDLPVTKTVLVGNSVSSNKDFTKLEKALPNQQKGSLADGTTMNSHTTDKIPEQHNKVEKEGSLSNSANTSAPTSGRTKLEPHKPLHLNMKLPALLRKTYVQENERKDDPAKVVPSSLFLQPPQSTPAKFRNEEKVQPVAKNSKNTDEKGETGAMGTANAYNVNGSSKPLVNGYKSDVPYSQYPRKYSPLWRANTPLLSSASNTSNLSNNNSPLTNGLYPSSSLSLSNYTYSISNASSPASSSPLVIKNDYTLKSSKKNSPIIPKHGRENSLQSKGNNHVKFRDPVVSEAFQRNHDPVPSHYSPASPRERMLSPTPKVPLNKSESPANVKKNQNGVTLLSDTLFTHFVVSNSLPGRLERDVASATDTDTDLETLERRLTLGMYAAPLVSSESCTSFSPDDGDEDPSATEYCTDTEEYNPHQYKAFSEENSPASCGTQALLLSKARNKRRNPKFLNVKGLDAAALVNTYSFFRKQSKAKKQRKNSFKELTPTSVSGGIVKPKNKTAKHMVAETFNAMFTLCTP